MAKDKFQNIKIDPFTKPMYKKLWYPAMASSVGWALSDMADAVVVGQKLGTVGLAAISLILPIYMINCAVVHGFGIGGSTQFSKLLSEGKEDEAKQNYTSIVLCTAIIAIGIAALGTIFINPLLGLLGTVESDGLLFEKTKDYLRVLLLATPLFYASNLLNYYLRNDNQGVIAGVGSLVGNIVDIACNISFVLFFNLGTFGAALSTAIGQIVSIVIYLYGIFVKADHLILVRMNRQSFNDALKCLKSGSATSIQYLYQMIFFLVCNKTLMAATGEDGVAVFDLIQNTSYLIIYLYEGTSRAMQPLVSTYFGEHNMTGLATIYIVGLLSGIIVGSVLIALICIWPQGICMLFGVAGSSAEATACFALRIYCIGAFFAGILIVLANYFQSCEKEKISFMIETLRGAVILIPTTLLFAAIPNKKLFWLIFPVTEILTYIIYTFISKKLEGEGFDETRIYQKTIQSTAEDIGTASDEVEEFSEKWEATMKQQYFMRMTIEEISMAILKHGLKGSKDGYLQITVIAQEDNTFDIHLRDNAITFNPFELEKDEKVEENSDFAAIGVDIIKKQSKSFFYRRYQGFNSLVIKI